MFTEEELEEVRDEYPNESDGKGGSYAKTNFLHAFGVSFFVTCLLIYLSFSSLAVVSLAASVGGTGGFVLEIERIQQESAVETPELFIYPAVAESSQCPMEEAALGPEGRPDPDASGDPGLPVLKADIENADVPSNTSISFRKAITTPNITGIDNVVIEINNAIKDQNGATIGYGDLEVGDATILVSNLQTDRLILSGSTVIDERYSRPDVPVTDPDFAADSPFGPSPTFQENPDLDNLGELVVQGEEADIRGAIGVGHFVSFEQLSVTNLNLEVQWNVNDAPVASGTCPV